MRDKRRNVMNSIKMNKEELLQIVCNNKVKHAEEYLEAVNDYKSAIVKIAESNLKLANTGSLESKWSTFPQPPVSYEKEYHRAIRMLQLSIDDVIEVEEDVFNQLVLDEWDWKRSFVGLSTLYKSI